MIDLTKLKVGIWIRFHTSSPSLFLIFGAKNKMNERFLKKVLTKHKICGIIIFA